MELYELDILINGLGIDPTYEHLNLLYDEFESDFVDLPPLMLDGLPVRVIMKKSTVAGYEGYAETFVHLITRKGEKGKRVFDRHRANRIHWIRCILENRKEEDIACFKYPEDDGTMRDYFWYKEGNFLVIMERILPNYLVITSFHIDKERNRKYFENKEKWYHRNK